MGSAGNSDSSETIIVVVKVIIGWLRRLRNVKREFWKEELGASLAGLGGGEDGEADEMGMMSGEGDCRARPLGVEELPRHGTTRIRGITDPELLL